MRLIETAIIILIIAKFFGFIWWSWWIVLTPFWLGALIFLVGIIRSSFRKR
jgi:hypothetical protein